MFKGNWYHPGDDHLSARDVAAYAARLRSEEFLAPDGRIMVSHLSHDGTPPYTDLVVYASPQGYKVIYNGLVI